MTALILDGLATAKAIKTELAAEVISLKSRGTAVGLGTILVGDDPGSLTYVSGKHRDCAEVGIESIRIDLPETASMADVLSLIPSDAADDLLCVDLGSLRSIKKKKTQQMIEST